MKKYKSVLKELGVDSLSIEGNQLSMMNSTNEEIICKHFRKDTGTCRSGCIKSNVQKGKDCPFDPKEQAGKCACFKN